MRLTIGIASYRNAEKLAQTIASIEAHTLSDWRLLIVHMPTDDDADVREVIEKAAKNPRVTPVWMDRNVGYCGAVNRLLVETAIGEDCAEPEREYVAYCDNDVEIRTPGWDMRMAALLDTNPECAWVFPGSGHYGHHNGRYHECLWNAGYCWMLRRAAADRIGSPWFDHSLGHHEEVDYMIRLRLGGFTIGCCPDVNVIHHETATRADDAAHKPGGRIHDGVVRWMNKWNHYFCGGALTYSMTGYDPRALRYTDWPPCALYLERWTLAHFPGWNRIVDSVNVPGVGAMDAVKVLKPAGPYRGRAI